MNKRPIESRSMFEPLESRTLLSTTASVVAGLVHSTAQLSRARAGMAVASAGNYAIFAGGSGRLGDSAAVDLYNGKTDEWSTAWLSEARSNIAAATVGHFALFAGGYNEDLGASDRVDIFNAETATWSTSRLSQPSVVDATAVVGNEAFFAGGSEGISDNVDIFDAATGQWATGKLSRPRVNMKATVVGSKVIFAGGNISTGTQSGFPLFQSVDDVDIYDASSDRWSTAHLAQARAVATVATMGNLAIFAAGLVSHDTIAGSGAPTAAVDIYNAATGHWSTATLSQPRIEIASAVVGHRALFTGGDSTGVGGLSNVVDVYNSDTGQWSTATLPEHVAHISSTTLGSIALFAGGQVFLANSHAVDFHDAHTAQWSSTALSAARSDCSAITVGRTALFAGGFADARHGQGPSVTNAVDLFTYDDTAPSASLVTPLAVLTKTRAPYTFSIAYHDASRIDPDALDNDDIVVTGPGGFSAQAHLVSQLRGKHSSTRIATYTVGAPGRRWDSSDNGAWQIHLQDNEVRDIAGNFAIGRRLGEFVIAIPLPPLAGGLVSLPPARLDEVPGIGFFDAEIYR